MEQDFILEVEIGIVRTACREFFGCGDFAVLIGILHKVQIACEVIEGLADGSADCSSTLAYPVYEFLKFLIMDFDERESLFQVFDFSRKNLKCACCLLESESYEFVSADTLHLFSSSGENRLYLTDKCAECCLVFNSHVGKCLSVELDVSQLEAVHEL